MAGNQFIQLLRHNPIFWYLAEKRHSAFILLTIIALRARRTNEIGDGLEIGEALIGDFEKYGVTERKYRSDKKLLEMLQISTFRTTNKGTIAKLSNSLVFDINAENRRADRRANRQTSDEQATTNNNENNEKNDTSRSADRAKKSSKETDPTFGVISKSLFSYMFSKTGVKQILVAKQMAAIKHIINAGYSEEDMRWAIDQLLEDPYWKEKGFDFMTVAGQLPKLKMVKPKTLEEQGYKHYKAKGSGDK